ncbi:MAG: SDR family oxidoreductase [Acidimicrobiales bacterium]|nr:MAG: oxidoreductase [Actinomycetales bacterium TMED115]RZP26349.1 MAG: SDR family oxidoreductase [Acidimicrobiales bacterium]|tara:strand:- start:44 stop:808 length:765 start_codon:yes stop_codon:yes gene_type:complete
MAQLTGSTAIITGGGRGIGLAIAQALAEQGASIGIVDVLEESSAAAAHLAEDYSVTAAGVVADVRDAQALDQAFSDLFDVLGTADILVTSAGITIWGDSIDVTPEDWQRVLDVNLNGTFYAAQSFARRLLAEQRTGSAILVSSMSAQIVNVPQFQASYHASKAAVSMLAKSLAVEWAKSGIRVNALEPGYTLSAMTREFMDANPDLAAQWTAMIPAGRMGEPEDLVGAVVYLASKNSSYMTGQSIVIDGGYTAI